MNKSTVISFVLACAVAVGSYFIYDQYFSGKSVGQTNGGSALKSVASTPPVAQPLPGSAQAKPDSEKIYKCFIDGKMTYTNQQCPDGAKRREVRLSDSSGIVGVTKLKAVVASSTPLATEMVPDQKPQPRHMRPAKPVGSECESLTKRIEVLDRMARQPQSGQSQDWLRRERSKVHDRQRAIQC